MTKPVSSSGGPTLTRLSMIASCLLLSVLPAAAADYQRGALVRVAQLYLSPDLNSAKLAEMDRGREIIVLETSREWLHVEANLSEERTVSGWMLDKGVVRKSTPNGDRILFGEAVDSEDQASRRHGRNGAAQDAMRLYNRVADYFPNSPAAGEAMYRSADIRWWSTDQFFWTALRDPTSDNFEKAAHRMEVINGSYTMYRNLVLANRNGEIVASAKNEDRSSKCPVKESEMYEKYAIEHPQSPATLEALYDAAWRWSALIEIYKTEEEPKKSEEAKSRAIALAQKVTSQAAQSDWGARAQRLLYLIDQAIPTYGNTTQ